MIIIMRPDATEENIKNVENVMESAGMKIHASTGVSCTIMGIVGNTHKLDHDSITLLEGVERIMKVQEPYKLVNRKFHPENTVINIKDFSIGGNEIVLMAGPCSVESQEQIISVAKDVKKSGAKVLRGGAYKPRTSPYSFQGLEESGITLLNNAKQETGMPIVTEIVSADQLDIFEEYVDIIQVGARNMQNYDLLKKLGKASKPILLKRGFSSTIEEWLMAAEYIMHHGNLNVILCERGIRTFETYTRNTLDISAIPAVKKLSHLPVVVDPSHSAGMRWMVEPLSMAAIAAGADGLIIEVHNDPARALCDGQQSLEPAEFDSLTAKLNAVAKVTGRRIG